MILPAPESATGDNAESIWVDLLDGGGGFNNATGDKASLSTEQLGGGEGVDEDEVVQARDTTEAIQ